MINLFLNQYELFEGKYPFQTKILRFIISGGTATVTNLTALFVLTHYIHIWYLISAALAFLFSFGVSFSLQKFWTFRDVSRNNMHKQAAVFFGVMIVGLIINTALIYYFVEFQKMHYLLAQFCSGIIIAFFNYAMYQKYIFHKI